MLEIFFVVWIKLNSRKINGTCSILVVKWWVACTTRAIKIHLLVAWINQTKRKRNWPKWEWMLLVTFLFNFFLSHPSSKFLFLLCVCARAVICAYAYAYHYYILRFLFGFPAYDTIVITLIVQIWMWCVCSMSLSSLFLLVPLLSATFFFLFKWRCCVAGIFFYLTHLRLWHVFFFSFVLHRKKIA